MEEGFLDQGMGGIKILFKLIKQIFKDLIKWDLINNKLHQTILNYEDQFNRSIQPLQSSLKPVGSTDNSVEV
jgi:hypothetical protein